MKDERLAEIIAIAIQKEEEAYAFYMDLNARINDKSAKDTIEWIAAEEKRHKEFLVNYRDRGHPSNVIEMKDVVYYKIAEHQKEPEIKAGMPSENVYLIASHRELRSYHLYSDMASLHPEGEVKTVLLKMANEELKHKEMMEYLYANTAFPQTSGG